MKYADLQLHTLYSDGTYTPATLVQEAKKVGLDCIALTDHDTVAGIAETAKLCESAGLEFIPGVELTAYVEPTGIGESREIHVLGYCIDPENPDLAKHLSTFRRARGTRIDAMLEKLRALGVELERRSVEALADPHGTLGRLHVARALKESGVVQSADEAFARFLGNGRPAWAPKYRVDAAEAASVIHKAGGVVILAHPGLARVDEMIPSLLKEGFDGIEVWHSRHSPAQAERYRKIAEQAGCLITGGSDCHGIAKDKATIGSVKLPYAYVECLKQFAESRRGAGMSQ